MKTNPYSYKYIIPVADVQTTCSILFDNSPIKYCCYLKLFRDGRSIVLCSDKTIFDSFLSAQVPFPRITANSSYLHTGYYLANNLTEKLQQQFTTRSIKILIDHLRIQREIFRLDPGLIIYHEYPEYADFFYLCSPTSTLTAHEWQLNNLDVLETFTHYFTDRLSTDIKNGNQQRQYLPDFEKVTTTSNLSQINHEQIERQRLLKTIWPEKFVLHHQNVTAMLTQREFMCLMLFVNNITAKEIGTILKLSFRTVEAYLNNIKNKLQVTYRHELRKIYSQSPYVNYYHTHCKLLTEAV